ncbi:MAG: carboxymuconolactone decarboxylase family protein, partial [Veillonellales bacterium]
AGLGRLGKDTPEVAAAYVNLTSACFVEGEIPAKYKELMALAIGVIQGCQYCISYHVYKALEEGANRDEVLEAATLAVAFGGSQAIGKAAILVEECLDAFEKK